MEMGTLRATVPEGSWIWRAREARTRFHGRFEGGRIIARARLRGSREFRAPGDERSGFDGPGQWRWLCLDHVRLFNSPIIVRGNERDEISAAQNPYGGWDRETRAFSTNGSPNPRWSDFTDPLDAIGARFQAHMQQRRRQDGRELSEGDRKYLRVLGLGMDVDRRALRMRYAELVRLYHPDHNGGDRGHEKALQAVIEAYTALKGRPVFA